MAVAAESYGSVDAGDSATISLSISSVALTGSNRHLDLFVAMDRNVASPTTVASISRGSDTFTQRASYEVVASSTPRLWGEIWMSTNEPQTASATLTCTLNDAIADWVFGYMNLTGVDQTTRYENLTRDTDEFGTTSGMAISSADGDRVVSAYMIKNEANLGCTAGGGLTRRISDGTPGTGSGTNLHVSEGNGAASVTPSWTELSSASAYMVHWAWNHPAAPSYTPPTASIDAPPAGYDTTIELGDPGVYLKGSNTGTDPITSRSWERRLDGGAWTEFSTIETPGVIEFPLAGTWEVRYTVDDGTNSDTSSTRTIVVLAPASPSESVRSLGRGGASAALIDLYVEAG